MSPTSGNQPLTPPVPSGASPAATWVNPVIPSRISMISRFASFVKDALFLATLIVTISSFVGAIAFKIGWPIFIDRLKTELNVITRDDFEVIKEQLDQVTGEDRVIRMSPGLSFVQEPIKMGEKVHLTLVVGKTRRGERCNLIEMTPLFVDERAIPTAGVTMTPPAQLQREARRFKLALDHPATMIPGRAGLNLGMKFSCPFGVDGDYIDVFEETSPIFFQLDP